MELTQLFLLPLIITSVMILSILSAKFMMLDVQNVINFLSLIVIGILSTFTATYVLDKLLGLGFQQNIKYIIEAL